MLSIEKPLTPLLRKPWLWFVTVLLNQRIMPWLLSHLTVMLELAHLLQGIDARVLLPEPLTGVWWATRPLWALVLLALAGIVVLVMGLFETLGPASGRRPGVDAARSRRDGDRRIGRDGERRRGQRAP